MPKFRGSIRIGVLIEASTVEAAMQELDNSVDLSVIRDRGHLVTDYGNDVYYRPDQENAP